MVKKKETDQELIDLFAGEESESDENLFRLPEPRKKIDPPAVRGEENADADITVDIDAEYARNNLYELIEQGMAAVQDLSHLSREQMHPRTYEVLSDLISTTTKNNLSLIELAEARKKAKIKEVEKPPIGGTNIDKAIFVGTSFDVLKMLNGDTTSVEVEQDDDDLI